MTRFVCISPLSTSDDGKLSEDSLTARQLLRELIPHVTDKVSRILFTSMDAVILDLWSRLVDSGKVDRKTFHLFVRDAATLIKPKHVVTLEGIQTETKDVSVRLETLPQNTALYALSDLVTLFATNKDGKQKSTPAAAKLVFYAAQIASLPPPILTAFSSEVEARARALEAESTIDRNTNARDLSFNDNKSQAPRETPGKLIEEL